MLPEEGGCIGEADALGVGDADRFKESALTYFPGMCEPGIIIGEDPFAIAGGGLIERGAAALRKDHGGGASNGGQIVGRRIATGAQPVFIAFENGVERQNHGLG